jgi:stage IV sporulation protein A
LRIDVKIPKWLRSFPVENSAVSKLFNAVKKSVEGIVTMRDCFHLEHLFSEDDDFINPDEIRLDLGKGRAEIFIGAKEKLFYQVLSETLGEEIVDACALTTYLREFAHVKREFLKVKGALENAEKTGYGIVYPSETEYELEKPTLVKKNAGYCVQFKAKATGYHVVKVDVTGSICPIIGTKQQGEDFLGDTLQAYEKEDGDVWETNIFGKSLRLLIGDELSEKADAMPKDLQRKIRRALFKIVNDGKSNLLCFVF